MQSLSVKENREEIRAWLSAIEYTGSILIELSVHNEAITLVTSFNEGLTQNYQYVFKKAVFIQASNFKLHAPQFAKYFEHQATGFFAEKQVGTYEVEQILLKTYPDFCVLRLILGSSVGECEFQFTELQTEEKLGVHHQRNGKPYITNFTTGRTITFERPFE